MLDKIAAKAVNDSYTTDGGRTMVPTHDGRWHDDDGETWYLVYPYFVDDLSYSAIDDAFDAILGAFLDQDDDEGDMVLKRTALLEFMDARMEAWQ